MAIKYCPECGSEYQEWTEKCLDCGAVLITSKPDLKAKLKTKQEIITKGDRKYVKEPLVVVASFTNTLEAHLNKGILEFEGIESMIATSDMVIGYQPDSSSVGNVRLVVKGSDVETAKEILESIQKNLSEDDISDDDFAGESMADTETPDKETG